MFIYNKKKVLIIHGPNINFLKKRELLYNKISLKKIKKNILIYNNNLLNIKFYNSNCEGKIINFIQKNLNSNYIILNPGAFTHYSLAILDCLKMFKGVLIENHFTNIYNREKYRKNSLISLNSKIIISGLGISSYLYLINFILND